MTLPVITIDGPAGVGKGTLAMGLARRLGFHYLDSGALYRALAYAGSLHRLPMEPVKRWVALANSLNIDFPSEHGYSACLDGRVIELQIRNEDCAGLASRLAAKTQVREALLRLQRRFLMSPGLVAEGRDMGTVVFPHAPCKIYLTASSHERAARRHKQLKQKGIDANFDDLLNSIQARDERDRNRKIAPLVAADDAVVVDTTHLAPSKVLEMALLLCKKKHITD